MSIELGSYGARVIDISERVQSSLAGDVGAEVAALLLDDANEARHGSAAARAAEEQHLERLEDQRVDAMLRSAAATRTAGWEQGLGQIVAGGLTMAGSAVLGSAAAKGDALTRAAELKATAWSDGLAAAGKAFDGTTTVLAADETYTAKLAEVEATKADSASATAERRLEDLSQEQRDANELARAALQAAGEWARAETAADQATLYLRG